ncbi:tripartite tricarboxylate transporter substrate-binding protein [Pantoea sp. 18069]|uniref:tripartite tricarboxylate transporter substrate-binding protein n=1 Tax=Pantoea sp. 18069 TaxID=2681415 RepID=UPI00135C8097|nr:tripartite tricarboxylate transporter substrate-binding protein [Pantoea sp. 18069]
MNNASPQHLAALMFETRSQVRMTHVPYKGGALAINDLMGGNVDPLFAPLPEALPYFKSGKLSALALMSDKRSALVADMPTMREAGVPNMVMPTWIGLLAPAATPRALVDQLNRQVHAIAAKRGREEAAARHRHGHGAHYARAVPADHPPRRSRCMRNW